MTMERTENSGRAKLPALGLREEKKDRTRSQLLDAALALFSKKGFEETTLAEIAAEVGVSTRTLLRYFGTKEDIVTSFVEENFEVFRVELAERLAADAVPRDALRRAALAMLASYEARPSYFRALERAIASSPAVLARKLALMEELQREARALLAKRAGGSARAELVADVHAGRTIALTRAALRAWTASETKRSLVKLYEDAESVTD